MALHDEIKEQKGKLAGKSFREKLDYFWYYYKVHTFVVIFVIIVGAFFIKDAITAKDYAFTATLLNAYASSTQSDLETDFAEYAGIDTDTYNCFIDTAAILSYDAMSQMDFAVSQRITAMSQTNSLDVLISDSDPFSNFALGMMFLDLREELTAEEFQKYEKDFFYIDAAAIDKADDEIVYDESGMIQIVDTSVDHSNPETMEDPIPVGIYLHSSPKLAEWNCYTAGETPILGFVYSSEQKDTSHLFLKYLTE